MRLAFQIVGGALVVLVSFFGTRYAMDYYIDRPARDATRTENAKMVMAALEKYRTAKGAYPLFPPALDVRTTQLTPLVEGGYLRAIPADPPGAEPNHYFSFDGKSFGLWLHLEQTGQCRIVVGGPGTGWWSDPPACRI